MAVGNAIRKYVMGARASPLMQLLKALTYTAKAPKGGHQLESVGWTEGGRPVATSRSLASCQTSSGMDPAEFQVGLVVTFVTRS